MAKVSIEEELLEATGIKGPKKGEDLQDYFGRLIDAVQDLKDPEWDKIGDPAQKWVNAGATSIKAKEEIENFPDAEPPAEEEDPPARTSRRGGKDKEDDAEAEAEDPPARGRRNARRGRGDADEGADAEAGDGAEDETETEEESVASKRSAKKSGSRAAAKSDKRPAAKEAKDKKPGAQLTIKQLIIRNPKLSSEDVVEKLKAKGLKATLSAVSTIRSGTLQTLRLVKELGMPKGDF